jgi:hypothetical protein
MENWRHFLIRLESQPAYYARATTDRLIGNYPIPEGGWTIMSARIVD